MLVWFVETVNEKEVHTFYRQIVGGSINVVSRRTCRLSQSAIRTSSYQAVGYRLPH